MKIAIDKLETGKIKLTLNHDAGKKPIVLELTPQEVKTVVTAMMMNTAAASAAFHFEISM